MKNSFGTLVRMLRTAKKKSQLDLALEAGISSKHLSFLESGRALPGRDVVSKLTLALELEGLYKNVLFASAGFSNDITLVNQDESDSLLSVLTFQMDEYSTLPACVTSWKDGKIKILNPAMNFLLSTLHGKEFREENLSVDELLLGEEGFGPFLLNFNFLAERLAICHSMEHMVGSVDDKQKSINLPTLEKNVPDILTIKLEYNGLLIFEIIQTVVGHPWDVNTRSARIFYLIPSDPNSKDLMKKMVSNGLNQIRYMDAIK